MWELLWALARKKILKPTYFDIQRVILATISQCLNRQTTYIKANYINFNFSLQDSKLKLKDKNFIQLHTRGQFSIYCSVFSKVQYKGFNILLRGCS
jgi:hypothetical protein